MDNRAALIVCVGVVLALALPAMFYAAYKDAGSWVRSMGRAVKGARNPFQREDQDLQELSRLVAPFKEDVHEDPVEGDGG